MLSRSFIQARGPSPASRVSASRAAAPLDLDTVAWPRHRTRSVGHGGTGGTVSYPAGPATTESGLPFPARVPPAPRDRMAAMRWPSRQQKVLNRVKKQLLTDDHHLESMLAFSTKLTREDAMPPAERIEAGPQRLLRAVLAGQRGHLHDQTSTKGKAPRAT